MSSDKGSAFKNLKINDPVDMYGKLIYKNLGKTIKLIAYIVAIATLLAGVVAAVLIVKANTGFLAIGLGLILLFAALAFIEFFIIYGIGHLIDQNNEILKKLG